MNPGPKGEAVEPRDFGIANLMNSHDWAGSPLGPREDWPQSLTTLVDMMLASGHAMCLVWGNEQTFLYNEAYAPLMGNRHPDGFGRSFAEAWPEIWDDIKPLVERTLAGETMTFKSLHLVMTRHGHPEDTWWDFSYSPVRDETGAVAGLLNVTLEATGRVQAERDRDLALAQVQENEERLRALVNASSDVLYTMSPDWLEMRQLDGRGFLSDTDAPTVRWIDEYLLPEDQPAILSVISEAIASKSVFECEHRVRRADGSIGWTFSRGVPILDEDGEITEWFGMAADVSARREAVEELRKLNETLEQRVEQRSQELLAAEEQLRQAQKMEAVGQLTGGLAHDFNNLLAGISGSFEMIGLRLAKGRLADAERYLAAGQGAATRAAALTHRLLAFSRRQTLAPRPTDVNVLVHELRDLLQRTVGPQITIKTSVDDELWPALVDPSQLENSILNLCINARDAMPDGGQITIETSNKTLDEAGAAHRDMSPGDYLSVSVSDTGVGMSPDTVAKAFEPFFTTKPLGEGTGLGLSMIYGFAKQSGGQVRIHSQPGIGTTVSILLPRHHGEAESRDNHARSELQPAGSGETVLVVDDEPTVRFLAMDVLAELGYSALEAADGASGLKVLQSDAHFDLLVTDVGLPGGMNGRQLADAARQSRPDLKVLFITGYAEQAVLDHQKLDPGMRILTKPFTVDALASCIRESLADQPVPPAS